MTELNADPSLPVMRVECTDPTTLNTHGSFRGAIAALKRSPRLSKGRETLRHLRGMTITSISAHPAAVFFRFHEGANLSVRAESGTVVWDLVAGPDQDPAPSLPPRLRLDFGSGFQTIWENQALLDDFLGKRLFFLAPELYALSLEAAGDAQALRFSTLLDVQRQRELLAFWPEAV